VSLDFSRCRTVWVPDDSDAGGFWSPPPPHVRYGVEQIIANPYFLLADDMGGMKTAQTIISTQFLHEMDVIDRVIVVAPAAIRPKVWYDEDLGQLREQVWNDKRNTVSEYHQKVRAWSHGPKEARELRWIVTNYEFIRRESNLIELLRYCGPKTMLVLDESSAVRTWDSAQTEAIMRLRWRDNAKGRPIWGVERCGRVLLLNGTPVAETPMDMFAQCNIMHPSILNCRYVTHFKGRYALQEAVLGYGGRPILSPHGKPVMKIASWTNLPDLQQRVAPYILRREAKDFGVDFALPPVGMDVALTNNTWKIYKEMRDNMVAWLTSGVATAATAATKSMRLAQITSGFLGGIEDSGIDDLHEQVDDMAQLALSMGVEFAPGKLDVLSNRPPSEVQEVGREKLDFALEWHEGLLKRYPELKLVTWCRFVPELKRYLKEVVDKFPNMSVGAACGQKVLDMVEGSQKAEREYALRLLHPKTAPNGAVTVGATQGTGAMGLNFTACRTVLDMSYDFSPWKKKQGDSRFNRPGQTGPVSFFYLVATGPKGQKTIDHHIMLTRLGKANVNDLTVAGWVKMLTEE